MEEVRLVSLLVVLIILVSIFICALCAGSGHHYPQPPKKPEGYDDRKSRGYIPEFHEGTMRHGRKPSTGMKPSTPPPSPLPNKDTAGIPSTQKVIVEVVIKDKRK